MIHALLSLRVTFSPSPLACLPPKYIKEIKKYTQHNLQQDFQGFGGLWHMLCL